MDPPPSSALSLFILVLYMFPSFPYNNRHGVLEGLCEHAPGADSVRWEGLCLQQSPEAVSPRGALGPGGLWFLVMCTLDGPSLA